MMCSVTLMAWILFLVFMAGFGAGQFIETVAHRWKAGGKP